MNLATLNSLVRKAKFTCSDQTSLNKGISYIKKTMQLNGCPLHFITKTINGPLQFDNWKRKSIDLEPLKTFISYQKVVAEKLKRVVRRKDLKGQVQTKQKDKMETAGVVYEG